ncbi:MAG TPA: PhoH family protein, partial [Myxococcaceae bacterium]|nr:PhoH family protein [Myxococcaceae bacterium]
HSKAVITGDITQVDLPVGKVSGLMHAHRILSGIPGINMSWFTDVDVVRHALVQAVIRAYEKSEAPAEPVPPEPVGQAVPPVVGIQEPMSDNLPAEGAGDTDTP